MFLKSLNNWDKLFFLNSIIILIIPPIAFLLHKSGMSIVYHQINIIFVLSFFISSILLIIIDQKNKILYLIPFLIFILFLITFFGTFNNVFSENIFSDFFGLFLSLTAAPLISVFLYKSYKHVGNINFFLYFIFYSGVLISIVNILMFVLLYFGDYSKIYSYTEFLGLGSYIEDLGSFFIRPAGYFFDYHSQYYIPIIAFFIVITEKIKFPRKNKLILLILLISILVSGIKSAYLTLIICIIYFIFKNISFVNLFRFTIGVLSVIFISNFFLDYFFIDLLYKIFTHDINILIEHIIEVPQILYNDYFNVFLFGGQVDFQNYIYSEVYYVTMIYYLGIIGVMILFIFPLIYTYFKNNDKFVRILIIIYGLSLIHYYVFKISFNIVGTSLFYFYFFKSLFLKQNAK